MIDIDRHVIDHAVKCAEWELMKVKKFKFSSSKLESHLLFTALLLEISLT